MNLKEYQELAKKTAKKDFATPSEEIMCWGLGVVGKNFTLVIFNNSIYISRIKFFGEAGDIASCIKKTFAHKKDVKDGIKENLGDMLWYSAMICNFFGWDMNKILNENIKSEISRRV